MQTASGLDAHPEYWGEYTNLQHVKHGLIKSYLDGWFPKLGFWAGRVAYIDAHAGRGRYADGQYGSPLVALRALLEHTHRDAILARSQVLFSFVERDADNLARLQEEIQAMGPLPERVVVEPRLGDCEQVILESIAALRAAGAGVAPAFVFVDPYGFRVQYSVLRELMARGRVELFVNVMWRYLDMAISNPAMASTLDLSLGGPEWRESITASDADQRSEQTLALIRRKVGARWMTSVRMLGPNRATKYILVHFTNHDAGRDLMKDVMWKVCPAHEGQFLARQADDPTQGALLTLQPDLGPLAEWVVEVLQRMPLRWSQLRTEIRASSWREKHLDDVVRSLRHRGTIVASGYRGRFSAKADPLLSVVTKV
jgi:three-Cys-motif partner protein